MGKSHAMSASAVALTTAGLGIGPIDATVTPVAVIALYTTVLVGGSLWPDWDSHGSTVVRSFGVFGKVAHQFINAIGLMVYNMTRTKHDGKKEGGHRTFFHTPAAAILTGFAISGLSSIGGNVDVLGKEYTVGQLFSLVIMWLFLHVGLAGIFEKSIKKAKKMVGVYVIMAASLGLTFLVSRFLPDNQNYWWLGIAATVGIIVHIFGDMITKMGIPMFWPIKIRGKRWYDVSLPSFMRITAGGTFENVVLFPLFSLVTTIGLFLCIPPLASFIRPYLPFLGG